MSDAADAPECGAGACPLAVALVNNMPDGAFLDTEEQFRRVLGAGAAGDWKIALGLYTITEIHRSQATQVIVRSRYQTLDRLFAHPPDALIVTGTEPVQPQLIYEPYWPYLANLLDWASTAVPAVMLSCLAAHASLQLFDGIERTQRAHKCSGVYRGAVRDRADMLADGLPAQVAMPHSRVNDIAEDRMIGAGYRIVIDSGDDAGWSVAARACGDALFVLCQGHPEYSTLSLLREYRRDVRRHLFGRGAVPYPSIPERYLADAAVDTLEAYARRVTTSEEDPRTLWDAFPYDQVAGTVVNTWAGGSATLYGNWLRAAHRAAAARA